MTCVECDADFTFDAGRVALDLMATLSCGSSSPDERLPDAQHLACWLRGAGLASHLVRTTAVDLHEIRLLRQALFRVVGGLVHDEPVPAAAVEVLNRIAAHPVPAPRLVIDADALLSVAPELDHMGARAVLARDAVDLLGGPERELLRECEADDCSGVYVDRSRGGRRRWCSTARCGNRARVAAHRARRHATQGTARRGEGERAGK